MNLFKPVNRFGGGVERLTRRISVVKIASRASIGRLACKVLPREVPRLREAGANWRYECRGKEKLLASPARSIASGASQRFRQRHTSTLSKTSALLPGWTRLAIGPAGCTNLPHEIPNFFIGVAREKRRVHIFDARRAGRFATLGTMWVCGSRRRVSMVPAPVSTPTTARSPALVPA